ncbi:MAG: hypothetical protein AAGF12_06955 [Myxococcota bacterium]
MKPRALAGVLLIALLGCAPELPEAIGGGCELNSDCEAPLVCRLARCRKECSTSRDCAVGLDCVQDNQTGLGACQLPDELNCVRDSDCAASLVCTMGECTNECGCTDPTVPCRDCPPGAACVPRPGGPPACLDTATDTCVRNSDCEASDTSFVCAPDQRCRVECTGDADCRFGDVCLPVSFVEMGSDIEGAFCVDALRAAVLQADGGVDASLDAMFDADGG